MLLLERVLSIEIQPIKREPEDSFPTRYENWKRWCIVRGMHGARAGSAEGGYSGPQGHGHPYGWGDWDQSAPLKIEVKPQINIPDAVQVNRAFMYLAMVAPSHAQVIKVLEFQTYLRETRQAQILGVHYQRLGQELFRARKMLQNQLRMLES
jgi:hypothetical protein